jgi:hypothetical protein
LRELLTGRLEVGENKKMGTVANMEKQEVKFFVDSEGKEKTQKRHLSVA